MSKFLRYLAITPLALLGGWLAFAFVAGIYNAAKESPATVALALFLLWALWGLLYLQAKGGRE